MTHAAAPTMERSKDQSRYNEYGKRRLRELRDRPETAVITKAYRWHPVLHADVLAAVGSSLGSQAILELGCGTGEFSVYCARFGARVTGVDIGGDLIAAARERARINGVECVFRQSNIVELPFASSEFDVVIGLAVLHHLCASDLRRAVQEAYRVLRPGGRAVFFEPVQKSRVIEYLRHTRSMHVRSKYSDYYRPSIWNRSAWRQFVESMDDRYLTVEELASATQQFERVVLQPKRLLGQLDWGAGVRSAAFVARLDDALLRAFPCFGALCAGVLVACDKPRGPDA